MQDILVKAGCYIAIILLGYVLRQRGFFGANAFEVISGIVIKITLPAAIIASSSGRAIPPSMLTITALGFGGGVLYILVAAALYRKQGKEKQAFAMLNTPGYNIGTFAMPFTQSFLGPIGVVTTSSTTVMTMLHTIAMELMALDRPTSPFSSLVKPGTALPMGLKARITSACRTSSSKGSTK